MKIDNLDKMIGGWFIGNFEPSYDIIKAIMKAITTIKLLQNIQLS